jgi:gluconokinase
MTEAAVADDDQPQLPVLVVMGVSGSGKSTVGRALVERLGWEFAEGDDMHPAANIAKMEAGVALTDDDRWSWLAEVSAWIRRHTDSGQPGVVTCSALKRRYRDVLRGDHVVFVYLAGNRDEITRRLAQRHGHYMPAALLDSQFDTLEPPAEDENAITIDVATTPGREADEIIHRLGLGRR